VNHHYWTITGISAAAGLFVLALSDGAHTGSRKDGFASLKKGEDIYLAACASCHGVDGRGNDRSSVAFEKALPDFSDCAFTSRETSADWVGIATHGGPVKAFSPLMPAFGDALSRNQLEKAVAHVKEFCPDKRWPQGEFNLPKALNTGKAFPENEVAWSLSCTVEEPVTIGGKFVVARRIGARHQIEAAIPFEVKQVERERADGSTATRWGEGAGDMAVAWKSVLWHSQRIGNIASLTLDVFFPTGDEHDEISDGIFAFEPAFAMGQIIPGIGFVQLQAGAELSTVPHRVPHGVFWRGAFGHTFRRGGFGRAFSPMVEVLGAKELEDGTAVEWDVVPQFQLALSRRQHIRMGLGYLIPISDFSGRQMKVMAYLIWDWFDGGFAEGWRP
jgi:mono/diheme cytochrome c family protein